MFSSSGAGGGAGGGGYERHPLVNKGKMDVDAQLKGLKSQQRKALAQASFFSAIFILLAVLLLLKLPFGTTLDVSGTCSPENPTIYYGLSTVNLLLLLVPLIYLFDAFRQFKLPIPYSGPQAIRFRPFYSRSNPNDPISTAESYQSHMTERNANLLLTALVSSFGLSLVGVLGTSSIAQAGDVCLSGLSGLKAMYGAGIGGTVVLFLAIVAFMVYQHKKQLKQEYDPKPGNIGGDHYHPL